MYNLLMQSRPWEGGRGVVLRGRTFEHTEDALVEQFTNEDGTPALDNLVRYPCLFMVEGTDDQIARVGFITRARIFGRNIPIEFAFDPDAPPLLNSTVFEHRGEFEIANDFEFHRNHWAIKDVDLYRLLLRLAQPRRQQPMVFALEEHERIDAELVSVMMPFDAAFRPVYGSIQRGVRAAGLQARRADDIWEAPTIIQDVVSLLDHSRAVICDCTGRNPNVFYEAGIAHTLGREVILITQNEGDIPFDLRHLRHIRYLDNPQGRRALSRALEERLNTIMAQ